MTPHRHLTTTTGTPAAATARATTRTDGATRTGATTRTRIAEETYP
uniref:Uncharacterized protein n=1 Tax=Streptomyces sp. NBC_00049 TaxID=2903617 RepID=A0AAU2JJ47_9ACTN